MKQKFNEYLFFSRVHVKLSVGDTLHIFAKNVDNTWVVDNEKGLLIYEPDLLVSATSVVGM